MAAEELVERVLAGDVHGEAPPAPPGAPPHLAQGGDGAGEGDDHRGVELADVDPQLQRVGGDHRAQLPAHEAALELAPLLGGVAGAVGDHEVGEALPSALGLLPSPVRPPPPACCAGGIRQPPSSWLSPVLIQLRLVALELLAHQPAEQLDALARLHEADRARAVAHEPREQLGGLAQRGAPRAERRVGQRRVPDRDPPPRRGRAVLVDQLDLLQAGQPLGQLERVGDRRGGEQEARLGAVRGGDAAQAAQHVGDVRAEHPAVDVRLVDHDHGEVGEQLGPRGVVGQDAEVEHVGVGEHHVRAAADLGTRLARGVAVVDRGAHALAEAERGAARGPGPARAPWSGRGRARAPGRRGRGRRAWGG